MNIVKKIDTWLSGITMYLLMIYFLFVLYLASIFFSFVGWIPYNPLDIILTGIYLVIICRVFNYAFAKIVKITPNAESQSITAFILTMIIGPVPFVQSLFFITAIGFFAMASKYVLAIRKQHIFNPAAFGAVATGLLMNQGTSWWAGGTPAVPILIVGGLLIAQKTKRFHMVISFFLTYLITQLIVTPNALTQTGFLSILSNVFLSPVNLFFAFIMLTEPITSPADRNYRIYFSVIIALIYGFLAQFAVTLEMALLIGNLLGRLVKFSSKYTLVLKEKKDTGAGNWEFFFEPLKPFTFIAGQYLEWSLPHAKVDTRGFRRYFTIASSPTEEKILLSVKIPEKSSSFKKALAAMKNGDSMYATNLEGEFTMQKKNHHHYVFIAGGIGITPFRSMVQYMMDKGLTTKATLFYKAKTQDEFLFQDIFTKAEKTIGLETVYILSEADKNWKGERGHLDKDMLTKYIKDISKPLFYLSGPQPMVEAYRDVLHKAGIKDSQIKTDFFPGYKETYTK